MGPVIAKPIVFGLPVDPYCWISDSCITRNLHYHDVTDMNGNSKCVFVEISYLPRTKADMPKMSSA